MEVRDTNNLVQNIKNGLESAKQTVKQTEIYEVGKMAYDVGKETMELTKDIKDTIGPAVSLGMTASSWMRGANGAMQCLVPNLGLFDINFDVTSLCNGMSWAGKEFGMPTLNDGELGKARRDIMRGRYSWTQYLKAESSGQKTSADTSPPTADEVKQLKKEASVMNAKRKALAHQANVDAIGISLSMAATGNGGVDEAIDSVSEMSGVSTLQERVGHTNKLLARLLIEMQYQRQVMAKMLLVMSADRLKEEPILWDLPETTWLDPDAGSKQ
jgi:hypothetical protein